VHTEKFRMIYHKIDAGFSMVMTLNVPYSTTTNKYYDDQISDHIYQSVLKQVYDLYQLFHGPMDSSLKQLGPDKLKENLKVYFDNFIENKLKSSVINSDIQNTFNGLKFMSLYRGMFLRIQSLLNQLEEKVPIANKVIVMFNDEIIW
jgi:hypothetical protein